MRRRQIGTDSRTSCWSTDSQRSVGRRRKDRDFRGTGSGRRYTAGMISVYGADGALDSTCGDRHVRGCSYVVAAYGDY